MRGRGRTVPPPPQPQPQPRAPLPLCPGSSCCRPCRPPLQQQARCKTSRQPAPLHAPYCCTTTPLPTTATSGRRGHPKRVGTAASCTPAATVAPVLAEGGRGAPAPSFRRVLACCTAAISCWVVAVALSCLTPCRLSRKRSRAQELRRATQQLVAAKKAAEEALRYSSSALLCCSLGPWPT